MAGVGEVFCGGGGDGERLIVFRCVDRRDYAGS